jgi:hypothetical protein
MKTVKSFDTSTFVNLPVVHFVYVSILWRYSWRYKPVKSEKIGTKENPHSLTGSGFHLVAETGFEPVTFGL